MDTDDDIINKNRSFDAYIIFLYSFVVFPSRLVIGNDSKEKDHSTFCEMVAIVQSADACLAIFLFFSCRKNYTFCLNHATSAINRYISLF